MKNTEELIKQEIRVIKFELEKCNVYTNNRTSEMKSYTDDQILDVEAVITKLREK